MREARKVAEADVEPVAYPEKAPPTAMTKVQMSIWRHDLFNLIALGAINALNCRYLLDGEGFMMFWYATVVYFAVDLLWIAVDPKCVKSPEVLAVHHVAAALYTLLPFFYPTTAIRMSWIMVVEVNTWLLIAKRLIKSQVLNILFYVTWVLIRNVLFPYLVWDVFMEYRRYAAESGTIWHPLGFAPIVQVALVLLNAQWTYELFRKTFYRKDKGSRSEQL